MFIELARIAEEWYSRMEELLQDLESNGFSVYDSNREYIDIYCPENETEYLLRLGGTERTIYIEKIDVI